MGMVSWLTTLSGERDEAPRRYEARAELTLSRDDALSLREVPLRPDPLTPFARAYAQLRDDLQESAEVVIDLMPVTQAQRQQRRRDVLAAERPSSASTKSSSNWTGELMAGLSGQAAGRRSPRPVNRRQEIGPLQQLDDRADVRRRSSKLLSVEPMFALQVLIRTSSEVKGRPEAHLHALIACFEQWSGENHFKVVGRNLLGLVHLGSDVAWRRRGFDRRMDTGLFKPEREVHVSAGELAGLLKPPTTHCKVQNVVRSGGVIPPPPQGLPAFTFQPDVLPLGKVRTPEGERAVGVYLKDTFFAYFGGRARYGKALALDTPIPTPEGWTTMGQLSPGDQVFDEAGRPCRVVVATPVMIDHEVYEVEFSDGSLIVADADHRWFTWTTAARKSLAGVASRAALPPQQPQFARDQSAKRSLPAVVTTVEMLESLRDHRGAANHAISVCEPLQYASGDLPLDAYVLGAWLGDGCSAHGGLTCGDPEIIEEIRNAGYSVTKWSDQAGTRPYAWGINGVLRQLGVLNHKHIPERYQRADVPQRLALLQGLMDTDGFVSASAGQCEFTSCSKRLAEGALELVIGLGIKATLCVDRARLNGRDCGERYRLSFTPSLAVFRLPRKRARQRLVDQHPSRQRRYVVAIRPVSSVPVRCISVDSPSHLYLAGRSCIPTHNTENAINQFIHLARSGHGCFFLDPHEDALNRIRPYLTDVADRVVELNLAPRGGAHRQGGWNLFSMEGLSREHIEGKVSAVVDSFASALRWGEINNRALTLTTMASQALLELALVLPPDLAPTIFQINSLLANEDWREAVIPVLSAPNREFWRTRFSKLQPEAITPVTNLIDRLRSSVSVSALLGSSRSTYDVRRAMDQGHIVLACPAGTGDKDRLVANFLVYDLLQAALSRKDLGPDKRRPFYLVLDEVQTFDGASRGNLAALLEQTGKYGVRALLCNQNPERLTPATFDAVTTNRSHLSATVLNARAARLIAKEWGDMVAPETIGRLERYTYLTSVTLKGQVTPPFLVRGFEVSELWAEHCGDDDAITAMNDTIDRNLRRRPVADTVADLDTLDERILAHLRQGRQGGGEHPPPATAAQGRGRHQRVRRN